MAIDKIQTASVSGLDATLLANNTNPEFQGTEAARMPNGTTA